MSFQFTDHCGHTYNSKDEVIDAALWLENDARFLSGLAQKATESFDKKQIADNAKHSAQYAAELRAALL